jgi:hypothetical protein
MELKDTSGDIVINQIEEQKMENKDDPDMGNISYIFSKPEILKMHLDILYKTVNFLDANKIQEGLEEYKEAKRIRLEAEQK